MANNEYDVSKKGYFVVLKMEHVEKMREFYHAPTSASPSAMIGWMCEDFLGDVELSAAAKRRVADEIKQNIERRNKRRQEWATSAERTIDHSRRKALRDAAKKMGTQKTAVKAAKGGK